MDAFHREDSLHTDRQASRDTEVHEKKKQSQEVRSFDPLRESVQKKSHGKMRQSDVSDRNDRSVADNTLDLATRFSNMTRGVLYGGSDRIRISSRNHKSLKEEVVVSGKLLDNAKEILGRTSDEMWSQAIDPKDFAAKYQKVEQNQRDANHHNKKVVTSQDIRSHLAQWGRDREDLSRLINQFNKIQKEIDGNFPQSVTAAQGTLTRLESIGNWRGQKGQLDKEDVLAFNFHRDRMRSHIQTYQESDRIATDNEQSKLLVELNASTKIISEFADKFATTNSSRKNIQSQERLQTREESRTATGSVYGEQISGWQGSSRETMEGLVRKVSQFDMSKYTSIEELHADIYELYAVNKRQPGFSRTIDEVSYQASLLNINPPADVGVELNGGFINFARETNNIIESGDKRMRRISLNIQPDHIQGVARSIVQNVSALPYVSEVKVAYLQREAIERLDNMVIYFSDPPRSGNRSDLEQRIRTHAPYTRPGHPAMMEPIDTNTQGIAFADQSKEDSFGNTRIWPIAEAAWKRPTQDTKNDGRALLADVEQKMIASSIDPDAPLWDAK